MILSGKCDNYCELYATVHLSFCDHKVAPLKDWLKRLQNLQLTHQQVSLHDGFDFVWKKTIEKAEAFLTFDGVAGEAVRPVEKQPQLKTEWEARLYKMILQRVWVWWAGVVLGRQ